MSDYDYDPLLDNDNDTLNQLFGAKNASVAPITNTTGLNGISTLLPNTPAQIVPSAVHPIVQRLNALKTNASTPTTPTSFTPPANRQSLSDILGKLQGNVVGAQQTGNTDDLIANLTRAGAQAGAAFVPMSGIKPDDAIYQSMSAQGQKPLQAVQVQQDMTNRGLQQSLLQNQAELSDRLNDPNSDVSKFNRSAYSGLVKLLGMTGEDNNQLVVPQNASASDLQSMEHGFMTGLEKYKAQQARIGMQSLNQQSRLQSAGDKSELAANRLANNQFNPYTKTLDSINRLQGLMNQVKNGSLTPSPQLAHQFVQDITTIQQGGSGGAVFDRMANEIHSMQGDGARLIQYLTGTPQAALPKGVLPQLQIEVNELGKATISNFADKAQELASGTKNKALQDVYVNRYQTQARKKGFDPDSYERIAQPEQLNRGPASNGIYNDYRTLNPTDQGFAKEAYSLINSSDAVQKRKAENTLLGLNLDPSNPPTRF